ncbi:MAG: NUDIX domain-containing protein [bacterium]|nr:NUDIX domain-containing protein [bacterium]
MSVQRLSATAILLNANGNVLLQLRDNLPTLPFPNTWTLLGGAVEAGEKPLDAVRRELTEEIEYAPEKLHFLKSYLHSENIEDHIFVGYIDIAEEQLNRQLHEGQRVKFFTPLEIREMTSFVPYGQKELLTEFFSAPIF